MLSAGLCFHIPTIVGGESSCAPVAKHSVTCVGEFTFGVTTHLQQPQPIPIGHLTPVTLKTTRKTKQNVLFVVFPQNNESLPHIQRSNALEIDPLSLAELRLLSLLAGLGQFVVLLG